MSRKQVGLYDTGNLCSVPVHDFRAAAGVDGAELPTCVQELPGGFGGSQRYGIAKKKECRNQCSPDSEFAENDAHLRFHSAGFTQPFTPGNASYIREVLQTRSPSIEEL